MTHPYRSPAEVPKHPRWGATRSARVWVRVYRWVKPKRILSHTPIEGLALERCLEELSEAWARLVSAHKRSIESLHEAEQRAIDKIEQEILRRMR